MFTTKNLLIVIGKNMGIAIAGIVAAYAIIALLNSEILSLTGAVIKNRSLANTLASRTELFTILKRDAEIVGSNDAVIERAFIPSDNILDFVAALESLALKNSVTQNFRFNSPTRATEAASIPLAEISYTSNLSTNILTLTNYLKDFERLPYFTQIEGLSLTAQDKGGWSGTSQASINAKLYTKATQ